MAVALVCIAFIWTGREGTFGGSNCELLWHCTVLHVHQYKHILWFRY